MAKKQLDVIIEARDMTAKGFQSAAQSAQKFQRTVDSQGGDSLVVGFKGAAAAAVRLRALIEAARGAVDLAALGVTLMKRDWEASAEIVKSLPFGIGDLARSSERLADVIGDFSAGAREFKAIAEETNRVFEERQKILAKQEEFLGGREEMAQSLAIAKARGQERQELKIMLDYWKKLAEIQKQSADIMLPQERAARIRDLNELTNLQIDESREAQAKADNERLEAMRKEQAAEEKKQADEKKRADESTKRAEAEARITELKAQGLEYQSKLAALAERERQAIEAALSAAERSAVARQFAAEREIVAAEEKARLERDAERARKELTRGLRGPEALGAPSILLNDRFHAIAARGASDRDSAVRRMVAGIETQTKKTHEQVALLKELRDELRQSNDDGGAYVI
ncbi:MAG: hypothetical protein AB7N71_04150 [Phycisphaerae bacterium]